ncbi:hypothetical protein AB6735_00220 [Mucilaginibacter sp. RCC_168]|uniref:hypothetical protein n=1 Tax=Mucilaginibacter sp. RCC_168 TaxID=3239221 RepID=UPI0035267A13
MKSKTLNFLIKIAFKIWHVFSRNRCRKELNINQKIKVMLVVLEVVAFLAVIILPLIPAKKMAK